MKSFTIAIASFFCSLGSLVFGQNFLELGIKSWPTNHTSYYNVGFGWLNDADQRRSLSTSYLIKNRPLNEIGKSGYQGRGVTLDYSLQWIKDQGITDNIVAYLVQENGAAYVRQNYMLERFPYQDSEIALYTAVVGLIEWTFGRFSFNCNINAANFNFGYEYSNWENPMLSERQRENAIFDFDLRFFSRFGFGVRFYFGSVQ